MQRSTRISPLNSLVFVEAVKGGEPPTPIWGATISSTTSCVSVASYPEQDGPTEVVLGDASDIKPEGKPEFDGHLETPNRTVVVSTVDQLVVLEMPVTDLRTRLRI